MMIEFIRTDHINICVPPEDLEKARRFYAGIMGLKQIERPDHLFPTAGCWFNIGDIQLHVSVEHAISRSTRHTAFEIKNVAAAREHLKKNAVEIVEEPILPGRDRFAFIDPFGNRMELLQVTGT